MEFENYEQRPSAIIRCEGDSLRAFVGDTLPGIGESLEIRSEAGDSVFAVVRRHVGGREVDALLLDPPAWVQPGCAVHATGKDAHMPLPSAGVTQLKDLAFSAGAEDATDTFAFRARELAFAELNGARPALSTGFGPVDTLAPVAAAGVNLVLDASPNADAFNTLCARIAAAGDFDAKLRLSNDGSPADWVTHQLELEPNPARQLTGVRVLTNWAARLRDQGQNLLVCAELPPLSTPGFTSPEDAAQGTSIGEVIDLLGTALSSTHTATVTTLLRLPLFDSAAGIDAIIETMSLGDVDAQIFVDADTRFVPTRSTSRAQLDADAQSQQQQLLSLLNRAANARDKAALLGEFGVTDAELQAIADADQLNVSLLD
ncbi:hypothetical protein [Bradymonas sediminis]|uniref:Uncharacterized protein n=1 Tax=Bradymonas sediminis TaxID=1548548 RepID=A0A2Z4FNV7_9DELT|nr:hypothetical protein [Bradymonas sediminis]AWV90633.1 hypothetical protein DN745_15405 [Bradymonas sediminis]TDP62364.1 hypothetical protein DFR33_11327 [Bradymonas sediminis]